MTGCANKLNKVKQICGTIHRTLKNKTRRQTRVKLYKTMSVPVLLHGSESLVLLQKTLGNIQAVEMRFLRAVKCYFLQEKISNENIRKELKIFSMLDKMN